MDVDYDVMIAGAGLAGLNAAYQLRDLRVLLCERDTRPGGRVLTRERDGLVYDLGASFACDPRAVPFPLDRSERIEESHRIALYASGALHFGESVAACLDTLPPGPERRERALDAFFQVIHPGERAGYLPQRQGDARLRFSTAHTTSGNGAVVAGFVRRLGTGTLRLSTEVTDVEDEDGFARVALKTGDRREEVRARAVILATPAPAARVVLRGAREPCRSFLASVRYGEGIVVAVGLADAALPDFAYLVAPDLAVSTVVKHRGHDPRRQVLLVYYAAAKSERVRGGTDTEIAQQTLSSLFELPLGLSERNVLFSDVHRWPLVGPIISGETYGSWDDLMMRPSMRVFLAGDYVSVDGDDPLPYGMAPALSSGDRAAGAVRTFLDHEASHRGYAASPLVDTTVYDLTDERPVYVERCDEGNVAFYGLVLQASGDERLKAYLLDQVRDGLWEYHIGYGVTAEDSAVVIEGLLAAGVGETFLRHRLQRLVELFYDAEEGAFRTVLRGRAAYWRGPSVDATAHVGYLLQRLAPDRYARQVGACAEYLRRVQRAEGDWKGRWFPSSLTTSYHAIRLLHSVEGGSTEALTRARERIRDTQREDGGWGGSVIGTSAAILALRTLDAHPDLVVRGREWLRARRHGQDWPGEPVLYYWFEAEKTRRFFHGTDRGAITSAWARLALAEDGSC
jgi:predicted NAD/FAD-dependent oxidoreductase